MVRRTFLLKYSLLFLKLRFLLLVKILNLDSISNIYIYIFLDIAKNNRRHDQRQICVVYIELYYVRIVKQEKITREEEREKKEMFLDKSEKFIHDVVREWLRWSWCKIVEGPRGRGLVSETSRQLKRHEKTRWAEFITH